jgi:hypothetical protein
MGDGYRGPIVDMIGYAGRIYVALDGGDDNYSSILLYNELGWHQAYIAPKAGKRIRTLAIQTMPETAIDRLYFSEGDDIAFIGIDLNPTENENFRYTPYGQVQIGDISLNRREIYKYFDEVDIRGVWPSLTGVRVEYTAALGHRVWQGEVTSDDTVSLGVADKQLRSLKLDLWTKNPEATPEVDSTVIKILEHKPVKWGYSWTMLVSNDKRSFGGRTSGTTVSTDISNLQAIVNDPIPIALTTNQPGAESLTVKLISMDWNPIELSSDGSVSKAVVQLTAMDT